MLPRGPTFVLVLAAAHLCGGCAPSIEPIEVAAGCPGQPIRGPEAYADEPADQLIDDFETGDKHLSSTAFPSGGWVLGGDLSGDVLIAQTSQRCAARGKYSGHFAASGYKTWNNNWTAIFRLPTSNTALPYDGSKWSAISFWAAFGADNGAPFDVPLGVTTMDNAWNGGVCNGGCMDYYGVKVRFSNNWERYVVRLDQMQQSGTGSPQLAMRREALVGFILWPRQQFDLWIDDVRFEP
jgi:hypothetical protein